MTRLRWTGGQFTDGSRGFRTVGPAEHDFEDEDRVEEYLEHRSGNWERVDETETETETESDGDEADVDDEGGDVQEDDSEGAADETAAEAEGEDDEISDDELVEILDGSVGDLEDALETGRYDDPAILDRLARIEREDGDPRTTAIEAIDARRED